MKNYDPNIVWGVHTIEVTLQQWGYVGHLMLKNTGNCRGKDVLDFDLECCVGETESDCDFQYHEEEDYFSATLKDEKGNTLKIYGDLSEFNSMIVKVEIIDYVKEKRD